MKRAGVPFDKKHFEKKKLAGEQLSTEKTFKEIYNSNHWSGNESVSGQGSADQQTLEIRKHIPQLVRALEIKSFLDLPCGDFHWFSEMDIELESYIGGDIVDEIVESNAKTYAKNNRKFMKLDLIQDPLPDADLLFCRDCLVHLSNEDIIKALDNIRQSNINYLLTTTFPECSQNQDIVTGDWRIINLQKAPFNFPTPLKLINEKCTEGKGTYADKSLGLWKTDGF